MKIFDEIRLTFLLSSIILSTRGRAAWQLAWLDASRSLNCMDTKLKGDLAEQAAIFQGLKKAFVFSLLLGIDFRMILFTNSIIDLFEYKLNMLGLINHPKIMLWTYVEQRQTEK